jgi:hypothetical protein
MTDKANAALGRIVRRALAMLHESCGDCDGRKAYRLWKPILDAVALKQQIAPIFTLNYDWTFEKLAIEQKQRYHLVDGFELLGGTWSSRRLSRIDVRPGKTTIALFKLHGSTNWLPGLTKSLGRFEPSEDDASGRALTMVYPAHRHEREFGDEYWSQAAPDDSPSWMNREPYETLYREFARWTKRARLIVIIGYAFGDKHVNEKIAAAMNAPRGPKVLVIDPGRDGAQDSDYWAPPFGALKFSELDWKWSQVHWLRGCFGAQGVTESLANAILHPDVLDRKRPRTHRRRGATSPWQG